MQDELRIYRVKPGAMQAWLREWQDRIRPLREKYGFQILGSWVNEQENEFIWILRHTGRGTYETANQAYYDSPERKAVDPDPARHLLSTEHRPLRSVD